MSDNQSALNVLQGWLSTTRDKLAEHSATEEKVDEVTGQGAHGKEETAKALETAGPANAKTAGVPSGPGPDKHNEQGSGANPDAKESTTPFTGAPVKNEVTKAQGSTDMAQKTARAEQLGDRLMSILQASVANRQVEALEKTAEAYIEKTASDASSLFEEMFAAGLRQRLIDESELEAAGLDKTALEAVGGIQGWLDKAAEEAPLDVMPPELAAEVGAEMGVDPAADMPMDPAAMGMGGGEGDDEAMIEQLSQVLDASGVTAEDLNEMIAAIQDLKAQGMSDEDIMAALQELAAEAEAGGGAEEIVPEMAPEPEKEAADRVSKIKQVLLQGIAR
jgi:hypothetical protein